MTSKSKLSYLVLSTALVMGGCTPDLDVLENTSPKAGDAFTAALTENYKELGQQNRNDLDLKDADEFGRKGLAAASGAYVQPLDPTRGGEVTGGRAQELANARAKLGEFFAMGLSNQFPKEMADAQVNYDCWVDETGDDAVNRNVQCKDKFWSVMHQIEVLSGYNGGNAVFFGSNSSQLDKQDHAVLNRVANQFKNSYARQVVLVGHTDPVGSRAHNLKLSQKRANHVKQALVSKGVPAAAIQVVAEGEDGNRGWWNARGYGHVHGQFGSPHFHNGYYSNGYYAKGYWNGSQNKASARRVEIFVR